MNYDNTNNNKLNESIEKSINPFRRTFNQTPDQERSQLPLQAAGRVGERSVVGLFVRRVQLRSLVHLRIPGSSLRRSYHHQPHQEHHKVGKVWR